MAGLARPRRSASQDAPERGWRRGACHRIVLVLWLAQLAGCTAVVFKPGASPGAMSADEHACRAASTDEAGYVTCMRDRGWFVTGAGGPPAGAGADIQAPKTHAVDRTPGVTATHEAAPVAPAAAAAQPVAPTAVATPAAAPAAPGDPLARVEVGSWWKLGGNAADLQHAIDACVGQLGEAHRPDPKASVVTAALRDCLRAAGWYALGGSVPR